MLTGLVEISLNYFYMTWLGDHKFRSRCGRVMNADHLPLLMYIRCFKIIYIYEPYLGHQLIISHLYRSFSSRNVGKHTISLNQMKIRSSAVWKKKSHLVQLLSQVFLFVFFVISKFAFGTKEIK